MNPWKTVGWLGCLGLLLGLVTLGSAVLRAQEGEVVKPTQAFEELRNRLRHGTRTGRIEAARELIRGGEQGFEVLKMELSRAALGMDTNDVTTVIASLGSEAVPLGLKLVQLEGYFDLRHHPAPELLGRMGVLALPNLSDLLKHSEAERRFDAVQGVRMTTFGLVSMGGQFLLAQATKDTDPWVRAAALEALGGYEFQTARMRWWGGLRTETSTAPADEVAREKLAESLQKCVAAGRFEPERHWPDLRELARTAATEDRATVARTMAMLGTNAAPGLDVIEKLLRDPDLGVALEAARALASVGVPGVPVIERASADPDPEVQRLAEQCHAVATFLRQVQPVDTLAIVERGLRDSSAEVVYGALEAAGFMSFSIEGTLRERLQRAVEAVDETMNEHVLKKRADVLETLKDEELSSPALDGSAGKPGPQ